MLHVLIIDDEPEFIQPQVSALQEAGYTVHVVTEPDKALKLLSQQDIDIIVLDLIMPPESVKDESESESLLILAETGVDLHKTILGMQGLNNIPIVFLSVVRDPDIRKELSKIEQVRGRRLHMLNKPASSSALLDEIKKALIEADQTAAKTIIYTVGIKNDNKD